MLRSGVITFGVLVLLAFTGEGRQGAPSAFAHDPVVAKKKLRVLFIGNSLTYYHDLPGVVRRLSQSSRGEIEIEAFAYTKPGATLEQHAADPVALASIQGKKRWDFVVLQEQGTRPVTEPDKMKSAARELHQVIDKTGAKTLLFMTWPPRNDQRAMDRIAAACERTAEDLGCAVAPVGRAWLKALEKNADLVLYEPDGGHPSPLGTYLTACVFFGALSGEKLEKLGVAQVEGLSEADAEILQTVAMETLKAHPAASPAARR